MNILPTGHERILRTRIAYTPRHVNLEAAATLQMRQHIAPKVGDLVLARVDVAVLEAVDGLYQNEAAALPSAPIFARTVNDVIFAAGDAMAVVKWLCRKGLPIFNKKILHDTAIAIEPGIRARVALST